MRPHPRKKKKKEKRKKREKRNNFVNKTIETIIKTSCCQKRAMEGTVRSKLNFTRALREVNPKLLSLSGKRGKERGERIPLGWKLRWILVFHSQILSREFNEKENRLQEMEHLRLLSLDRYRERVREKIKFVFAGRTKEVCVCVCNFLSFFLPLSNVLSSAEERWN